MSLRLLVDEPRAGAANMAVDEALLDSVRAGGAPTVRFYHFASPSVTFGYGQRLEEACNEDACRRHGIARIRRVTGGRALLHQHELTFSVVLTRPDGPRLRPRDAYRGVTRALRGALAALGVPLDRPTEARDPDRVARSAPCLSSPAGHELTAQGRKLVASAMCRRGGAVLVHGVILWQIDRELCRELWTDVASVKGDWTTDAAGISELVPEELTERQLLDALTTSFESVFGLPLRAGALTRSEVVRAADLEEKYLSAQWTDRLGPEAARAFG